MSYNISRASISVRDFSGELRNKRVSHGDYWKVSVSGRRNHKFQSTKTGACVVNLGMSMKPK